MTFQGVPEYSVSNSNSVQIELFFDGRIRITCLGIAATDGLIGLSRGQGVPGGFVESDFSAYPAPPTVVTIAATDMTTTGATLNGTVNPNGQATTAKFEYGLTTAYGSPVSATLASNNGSSEQSVAANLTGFTPGTTYHFHATATNPDGTTDGGDLTFTTLTLLQSWRQQYFGTMANVGQRGGHGRPGRGRGQQPLRVCGGAAAERFTLAVQRARGRRWPGNPAKRRSSSARSFAGRTYVVKCKASLSDPTWTALVQLHDKRQLRRAHSDRPRRGLRGEVLHGGDRAAVEA